MLRIGLTGGVASGKSIVAAAFVELGASLVDTDAVAREVVARGSPGLAAVIEAFGEGVLDEHGDLDRRHMRTLVFEDAERRRRLERILHPLIRERTLAAVEAAAGPYVVVAVPLLVEARFGELVDRVLVVDCPPEVQAERLVERDRIDAAAAWAMIRAQTDRETRLAAADDVIDNSGSLTSTRAQVVALHERYLALAHASVHEPEPSPNAVTFAGGADDAQNTKSNMVQSANSMTDQGLAQDAVRFEQPLTERMRTFLRVEFLYQQALFHADHRAEFSTRAAVSSLLEILSIVGRGDVRSEVVKELDRHADMLERFRRRPGVDDSRCAGLLEDIGNLKKRMRSLGAKFAAPLKDSEFLSTIKHRSSIPGGTCMFDLPDYGYWLHLPHTERSAHLNHWLDQLKPLCDSIDEVLWLVREATDPVQRTARQGLYHEQLDRNEQHNLVRVEVPRAQRIYPEISAGQHRFTIRFLEWQDVDTRPKAVEQDIPFSLALC